MSNICLRNLQGESVEYFVPMPDDKPIKLGDGTYAIVFQVHLGGEGGEVHALKILYNKHAEFNNEDDQVLSELSDREDDHDFFLQNIDMIQNPLLRNFFNEITIGSRMIGEDGRDRAFNMVKPSAYTLSLASQPGFGTVKAWCDNQRLDISDYAYVMPYYTTTLEEVLSSAHSDWLPPATERDGSERRAEHKSGYNYLSSLPAEDRYQIIIDIIDQIARGVRSLHLAGIAHRDLKPSNIFIRINLNEVSFAIGDYGFAFYQNEDHMERAVFEIKNTMFAPLGTYHFRSPEQRNSMMRFLVSAKVVNNDLKIKIKDSKYGLTFGVEKKDTIFFEKERVSEPYLVHDITPGSSPVITVNFADGTGHGDDAGIHSDFERIETEYSGGKGEPGNIEVDRSGDTSEIVTNEDMSDISYDGTQEDSTLSQELAFNISEAHTNDVHSLEDNNTQIVVYKKIGKRSDIFSLGCILYDLLTCGDYSGEFLYDYLQPHIKIKTGEGPDEFSSKGLTIAEFISTFDREIRTGVSKTFGEIYDILKPKKLAYDYIDIDLISIILKCFMYNDPDSFCYNPEQEEPIELFVKEIERLRTERKWVSRAHTLIFQEADGEERDSGYKSIGEFTNAQDDDFHRKVAPFYSCNLTIDRIIQESKMSDSEPYFRLSPRGIMIDASLNNVQFDRKIINSPSLDQVLNTIRNGKIADDYALPFDDKFSHPFLSLPSRPIVILSAKSDQEQCQLHYTYFDEKINILTLEPNDFITFRPFGEDNSPHFTFLIKECDDHTAQAVPVFEGGQHFTELQNQTAGHYYKNYFDSRGEQFSIASLLFEMCQVTPNPEGIKTIFNQVYQMLQILGLLDPTSIKESKIIDISGQTDRSDLTSHLSNIITKLIFWFIPGSYYSQSYDKVEGGLWNSIYTKTGNQKQSLYQWRSKFIDDYNSYILTYLKDTCGFGSLGEFRSWQNYTEGKDEKLAIELERIEITEKDILDQIQFHSEPITKRYVSYFLDQIVDQNVIDDISQQMITRMASVDKLKSAIGQSKNLRFNFLGQPCSKKT